MQQTAETHSTSRARRGGRAGGKRVLAIFPATVHSIGISPSANNNYSVLWEGREGVRAVSSPPHPPHPLPYRRQTDSPEEESSLDRCVNHLEGERWRGWG